jgi:hypothetical protein
LVFNKANPIKATASRNKSEPPPPQNSNLACLAEVFAFVLATRRADQAVSQNEANLESDVISTNHPAAGDKTAEQNKPI